jgi:hypothetical protein
MYLKGGILMDRNWAMEKKLEFKNKKQDKSFCIKYFLKTSFLSKEKAICLFLFTIYIIFHKNLIFSLSMCLDYFETFLSSVSFLSFFICFAATFSFHFKPLQQMFLLGFVLFLMGTVLSLIRYDFLLIVFKAFDGSSYHVASKPLWFWQVDILQLVGIIYIFLGLFYTVFKSSLWLIPLSMICVYIHPLLIIPIAGLVLAKLSIRFGFDFLLKPIDDVSLKFKILGIYSAYWIIVIFISSIS